MLDIAFIRENPDLVSTAAKNKRVDVDVNHLLKLDSERRTLQQQLDELQRQRNTLAQQGGTGKPSSQTIATGKALKEQLTSLQATFNQTEADYLLLLQKVPNIPSADTPVGPDASGNVVLRQVGEVPTFDFTPKEHWELGEALGLIDNERAAKVSGSRFTYLKGELVFLEFALIHYALSVLTNAETLATIAQQQGLTVATTPFLPVLPPVLAKKETMQRMARLEPVEERYHIPSDDLYLVGSAEHTLGPLHMDETLSAQALPLRYVGFSPSFRREAGSYGKDIRGILRMHQFDKIEMESFTSPETSLAEQDFIVAIQEHLMQGLGLPYQVVQNCTGDMGAPDARQIDIETWLPGQNQYRETHSSDYMTDYQARRLRTKIKGESGSQYVHMNDATVFAIGRTLIAIMENYQLADGSITVPEVLQPYVPFAIIAPKK